MHSKELLQREIFSQGRPFPFCGRTGFEPEVPLFNINEHGIGVDAVFIHAGKFLPFGKSFGVDKSLRFAVSDPSAGGMFFDGGPENVSVRNDFSRYIVEKQSGIPLVVNTGTVENIVPDLNIGRTPEEQRDHDCIDDGVVDDFDVSVRNVEGVVTIHDHIVFNDQSGGLSGGDEASGAPVGFRVAVADRHAGSVGKTDDILSCGGVAVDEFYSVNDEVPFVV